MSARGNGRHGDWPLYPPDPDERFGGYFTDEERLLYEQISAPIETGVCECEADCHCPGYDGEPGE
jgi:hypothetical protein